MRTLLVGPAVEKLKGGSQVSNNPKNITYGKYINIRKKKKSHLSPKVGMISESGISGY